MEVEVSGGRVVEVEVSGAWACGGGVVEVEVSGGRMVEVEESGIHCSSPEIY